MGNGWRLNRLSSPQTSSFDGFYLTQRLRTQIGYPTGTELVLSGSPSFPMSVFLSLFFFPLFLTLFLSLSFFITSFCLFLFHVSSLSLFGLIRPFSVKVHTFVLQNMWRKHMSENKLKCFFFLSLGSLYFLI